MSFEDLTIREQLQATGLSELKLVPTYLHDDEDPPRIDLGFWSCVFKFPNDRAIQVQMEAPVHPMSPRDVMDAVGHIHHSVVEQVHHGWMGKDGRFEPAMPDMLWHVNNGRVVEWLDRHIRIWLVARIEGARALAERRSLEDALAEAEWRSDTGVKPTLQ
jgi:hypothetical protein